MNGLRFGAARSAKYMEITEDLPSANAPSGVFPVTTTRDLLAGVTVINEQPGAFRVSMTVGREPRTTQESEHGLYLP